MTRKQGGRIVGASLAAAAVLALVVASVWWRRHPADHDEASRPVAVIISGDTAGWIVPCGCTSNQSGGLPRRGHYVDSAGQGAEVLVADAGGAPGGTSPYQRLKFEAILRGELAMGLAAHNVGGPEAALGADYLRHVGDRLGVPFVSCNVRDSRGELVAESVRVVRRGARRVAVAGVLSPHYAATGLRVDDPREALVGVCARARGTYDTLVVLAYLPEEELRQLAADLPEADAVVGGPTGQSIAPRRAGATLLASATNKGKFLVHLEASAGGGRPNWQGKVAEMGPGLADDPGQRENLRVYLAELARHDFAADETGLAPMLPAGLPKNYRLAGDGACKMCHARDCKLWQASKHAEAWQTLVRHGAHVDPACQQCHTTGYGLPGGFESMARTPGAVSVRCEGCHGPCLAHVQQPTSRTPFVAADQCTRCHDPENSPRFVYKDYWPRIRHGAPAKRLRSNR
jgi:hypothetical protein